eukprot:TRINITY_DN6479_c0_g1_i4.p1 TRINITY_DN6479_c0_g1~~TRINITY_DN6479_c0_g1_i4.p1  ORF type:complete len:584 (-),score=124.60 TRINITY_DN6479_c0_g1_i4:139-1890(-)
MNPNAAEFVPGRFSFSTVLQSQAPPPAARPDDKPKPAETKSTPTVRPDDKPKPAETKTSPPTVRTEDKPVETKTSPPESWEARLPEPTKPTKQTKEKKSHKQEISELEETEDVKDEKGYDPADKFKDLSLEDDDKVVDDNREHLNVVFIGHVDHGKSTICGNILYLTGMVDERTMEKYKKEAKDRNRMGWFFAMIMDLIEEERAKGKTVEVGRAQFETENKRYTILDCPGHENFMTNMITGASQADIAVLVVSARKGEFEDGFVLPEKQVASAPHRQTREHAILAKTLGVRKLIVAINKMDDSTVQWSKERYDEIEGKISNFLKSLGYASSDVIFLPVSGLTGINIKDSMTSDWYHGPPLLTILDTLKSLDRLDKAPLYIPVLGRFKDQRGNLVILGKVETGILKKGDVLSLMPGNTKFTPLYFGNDIGRLTVARPGENIQIAVKGVKEDLIHKGFVLCDAKNILPPVSEFVGQVMIIDLPTHTPVLTNGYKAVIHMHTSVEDCTFQNILAVIDRKTGQKSRTRYVKGRALVDVHISLAQPVCMTTFADVNIMGRFTLRDADKTIGFGKVLKLGPPGIKSKKN